MDSFTIELVSNASLQLFPNNTLCSSTNFLPEQVNLDEQWEVAISDISYPSMYQNVTEGKIMFYDEKLSKTTEAYYLEPGLYSSITDIQERNNYRDTCITIKISTVTPKVKVYLANDESSLAIVSIDLGHTFGGDVRNGSVILMSGKGPHEPTFAYDTVRIHSLMIYIDIVEYKSIVDTKALLLRCFPFITKLKSGDKITTGQNMNYQTFSNLQCRRLLKNLFTAYTVICEKPLVRKFPLSRWEKLDLFSCLEKFLTFICIKISV